MFKRGSLARRSSSKLNPHFSCTNRKRGQVTIFIILAILIVAGILAFILIYDPVKEEIPREVDAIYEYYASCLEEQTRQGAVLLGEQGGHIYTDELEFVEGSDYIPFSSQLDFFGQAVPYWFYVSGNNVVGEQKPTLSEMESELGRYVSERSDFCDFESFYSQGFSIFVDEGEVSTKIKDDKIEVVSNSALTVHSSDGSYYFSKQKIDVDSNLGNFYDLASDIYDYEMENMFLENYTLDAMWLYVPVSGVETTCSPLVFDKQQITEDLKGALAANIQSIKLKGSYHSGDEDYFVKDIGRSVKQNVNFIYAPSWTSKVEIYGEDIIRPVGLQPGMQALGFCYAPYKFIYDIDMPVMVQIYSDDGSELFQFPVSVIVRKNQAREAIIGGDVSGLKDEICPYTNQQIEVYSYDSRLNPVEAELSFKCLDVTCPMGESKIEGGDAVYRGLVPQCVNGFVLARAEGYADSKEQISTNTEDYANIVLRKKHNLSLDLVNIGGNALVSFVSDDYFESVYYPEMSSVELVEGAYNISVYVYSDSELKIPASSRRECVDVPQPGVGGFFGLEEERCFNLDIPEVEVEMAVIGGGSNSDYFTEGMLENSKELNINVPLFGNPRSLEDLQKNFVEVEANLVQISLE